MISLGDRLTVGEDGKVRLDGDLVECSRCNQTICQAVDGDRFEYWISVNGPVFNHLKGECPK